MSTIKNILVTGSEGQLGKTFQKISKQTSLGYRFHFTDISELDITNLLAVRAYCKDHSINFMINCAAYTAVDQAEDDHEKAYLINSFGISVLSQVCEELDIFLVHVSTDYVFDGTSEEAYKEGMVPCPISVYGASKYEGEQKMVLSGVHGAIVRTSWLYSEFGKNFVSTILRISSENSTIRIVDDQRGTPTNSFDLAEVILGIIEKSSSISGCEIFHYSNDGSCSWYEFAKYIVLQKGISCTVEGIPTSEFKTKAKRPHNSVLNKEKIIKFLRKAPPKWEKSLNKVLEIIE